MSTADGKVALVTGGARRIGRAIALDLAACGHAVAIHANTSFVEAEMLAAEIVASGGRAAAVAADLSDPDAVAGLLPAAEERLGLVTVLVNNASEFEPDDVLAIDPVLFERQMRVNLMAPCQLAGALANRLPVGAEGVVVNLIDQRVWRLTPTYFSYTLSKSALWTATRTMAQRLAPRVRVAAIGPGPTLANRRQSEANFHAEAAALPLEKGPSLGEIAAAVRFILETPSYTGQMLALDGGQHLAWRTPDTLVPE